MESVWFLPQLSDEIIKGDNVYQDINNIIIDILADRLNIARLVENLAGVLTNTDPENREKGMLFFTAVLKKLPKDYFSESQLKFVAKFYTDRLKDNHRVIPPVIDGYVTIVDMKNYSMQCSSEFFTLLFREVPCQSQLRQDRYNIYLIIQKIMEKDIESLKLMGPDFVYGFISAMDGERDPRNLLLLFGFIPKLISQIPLGHLVDEMFDNVSCYFPIDFYPSSDDPTAVTRDELATALCPCLCAVPEFGEQCLVLIIEKLDSQLRVAKLDSLKLLKKSCQIFKAESYGPFMKALWSSIHREIMHKTDEELRITAHEALSAIVTKLSTTANTDQAFENFVKGIIILTQTTIAEASTVNQFVQATKVLLTAANASKESCIIVSKQMISAIVAYYDFKQTAKLQIASVKFLGDLYQLLKHWEVAGQIEEQANQIPQLCLTAVSSPLKEFQIAGFKTLIKVIDTLKPDLVVPFVEVLIYIVQHSQDTDLLTLSVETVHAIARKYPELIMNLVVKGRCDLDNLVENKTALDKRLNILTSLASIDDFTQVIIEEMLKIVSNFNEEAPKVVEALSDSISNTNLFTNQKVVQIESDHGIISSVIAWLSNEIQNHSREFPFGSLSSGLDLITNTMASLPAEKQKIILKTHTKDLLEKIKINEFYFHIVHSLYSPLHQSLHDNEIDEVMKLCLDFCLGSEDKKLKTDASVLIAHFLNKAEYGQYFETLYDILKNHLSGCSRNDHKLCGKLINLYGWITKALVMRGSDLFSFWLQKITITLSSNKYCTDGAEAIDLIMTDYDKYLTMKQHCRISLLYKQRIFLTFSKLAQKIDYSNDEIKEAYLLSWCHILGKVPKKVLFSDIEKIAPLVVMSLDYDNPDLLLVSIDIICHFAQAQLPNIADSLQTILPKLTGLSKFVKSMDVRIKSLQCLCEIAVAYTTIQLLPYKQDVLFEIAPALDDRKRLVRSMAVKARTRWFLIGAPGEPE